MMDSSLITIWGRSGAGKTTLAVNLACALAESRCVGLISSNLQYGNLQSFFGQTIGANKGLLNALESPSRTKDFFWKSGLSENLFLLSVPNDYTGLNADNVSQEDVESLLDRARPYFDILIVDGCEDITNPVSSVSIAHSGQILVLHKPTVASGLWYRSMGDFIYQLHLEGRLTHVIQETPWSVQPDEYASALRILAESHLPHIPDALRLEDSGKPVFFDSSKMCKRYVRELRKIITLTDKEVSV